MKTIVIHNPYSSRWKSGQRREEAETALNDVGIVFDLVQTSGKRHAVELASQAVKEGYQTIVAAGGDGTIGEVVNGIMQSSGTGAMPILGVLPLGTANDLVHNLNLPVDLSGAANIIAAGKTRKIDVCQVNDLYFINNAGLGLEPYTTTVQEKMTRVKGTLRYLLATLVSIMKNPQWEGKLAWDDGEYEGPVTMVSIGNCALTGGIFYTVPHAQPFDGKLTFVYGSIQSRLKILQVLPRTMKPGEGNYVEHPSVHEHECTWLKVKLNPGTPAHTDGELFSYDIQELEYKVHPAKLPILIGE